MDERSEGSTVLLLVNADHDFGRVVARVLARAGFVVETARGAVEALSAILLRQFDVVIAEQSSTGMLGDELVGYIRRKDPHLPVLFYADTPMESAGIGCLAKPFTAAELVDPVRSAVHLHVSARTRALHPKLSAPP